MKDTTKKMKWKMLKKKEQAQNIRIIKNPSTYTNKTGRTKTDAPKLQHSL